MRPSFVCFITDQQRGDHCGGAESNIIRTPNIDRIEEEVASGPGRVARV